MNDTENKEGFRPWYPNENALKSSLSPGYCVIGLPDPSFGIVVFSKPIRGVLAEKKLDYMKNSYPAALKFKLFSSSVCSNCCREQVIEGTNLCSLCKKLFDHAREAGNLFAA